MMRGVRLRASVAFFAAAALMPGATTTTWEMNAYSDFLKGRFTGTALDRDGKLRLAPRIDTLFSSGQSAIWSVVQAPDGSYFAGTGHRGRVYHVTAAGANTLVWTS